MSRTRVLGSISLLVAAGALLSFWALREARVQRLETEETLRAEAAVLAGSLVPALTAASTAARELDEVVAWKLLDNARLLARLDAVKALDEEGLLRILADNGLDSVLTLDQRERILWQAGDEVPLHLLLERVRVVLAGEADEVVLGFTSDEQGGHVAAAAARPGGGAVLVRAHASTAYAYARQLGVARLLDNTVGTSGVLCLAFREEPGGYRAATTWDGGPMPDCAGEEGEMLTVRGREVLALNFSVPVPAGRTATLQVGLDAAPLLRATASATRRTALVGAVLAAFALAIVAYALVSRSRALEREEGARRLSALEEARRRSERLATAGSLAAGVAHEIRNPLNAISLAAQRIERHYPEDDDCREFARRIRGEVGRLEGILRGFLDLARPVSGPRQPTDLATLAREVTRFFEIEAGARRIRLEMVGPEGEVRGPVDGEAVRRALVNLIRNALETSPEGARVEVVVEPAASGVRICVRDEGPGIDPKLGDRVFDPFVTNRAEGTGLGLPLVRRVAEEHGGRATLENRPSGGAEAVLELSFGEETG